MCWLFVVAADYGVAVPCVPILAFERVDVQLIAVSVFKGVGEAVVRHAITISFLGRVEFSVRY